jgi:hypothetical protein
VIPTAEGGLCWLLNPSTAVDERLIRVRDDLAVEVKRDRLLIQRGNAEVEVRHPARFGTW